MDRSKGCDLPVPFNISFKIVNLLKLSVEILKNSIKLKIRGKLEGWNYRLLGSKYFIQTIRFNRLHEAALRTSLDLWIVNSGTLSAEIEGCES